VSTCLTDEEIEQITGLVQPAAQARKLRELGFVVIGFSARGRVRALSEHPARPTAADREESVRLNFG